MNNNIDRITREIAKTCIEELGRQNVSADKIIDLLNNRPINKIRISENALNLCLENNVQPFDYFILRRSDLIKKYGNFFDCYLITDYNIANKLILDQMIDLYKKDHSVNASKYIQILNAQSYDLITLEEKNNQCSNKIGFVDLWLTPIDVIDKFFAITKLNKDECLDPCASDGRWLNGKGYSIDILPTKKDVVKKDFLTITENDLPANIKTIVGNLPFSLLDEFVNKSLELVDDCYFLVNGDTIFKHFPNNIEHIYIFSGLEGNQKDNRSRCEFDVPFLVKSALWCCIVHLTKKEQEEWVIESNIDNATKRDGFHIALGKNTFIKSDVLVDENPRITKIPVTSSIIWKGGKKLINADGTITDLKDLSHYINKQ